MKTPYGLLAGTYRTTRRGKFQCHVVDFIGPDRVRVQWQDHAGCESVIKCADLDRLPQANNPPHGLNWGTFRTFKDGGTCRVDRHFNVALLSVTLSDDPRPRYIHPNALEPITE